MREILFRGKRKDNGKWIESLTLLKLGDCLYMFQSAMCEITYDLQYNITSVIGKSPFFVEVIPETIGQYTGLVDKNGTKIFEGDIVKIWDNGEARGVVRWCDEDATFEFYIDGLAWNFGGLRDFCLDKTVEVVGNVHDNPELLVGEEIRDKFKED